MKFKVPDNNELEGVQFIVTRSIRARIKLFCRKMKKTIVTIGLIGSPFLEWAIRVTESGLILSTLKMPAIALGLAITLMLHYRMRHSVTCAAIFLALYVIAGALAVGYIGATSSLYPVWKVIIYGAILLLSLASFVTALIYSREILGPQKKKQNKPALDNP